MKRMYFFAVALFTATLGFGQTDLYFSMYGEGSSNNKFLVIYNNTGATVDLSDYAFPSVSNSPNTVGEYEYWNKFSDGATIEQGDVYVICHPSAEASILSHADQTHQYLSNGDDGFALVKGGTWDDANTNGNIDEGEMTGFTVLDWIGDWQGDPGSGWSVAGVDNGTKDHTLIRKKSVTGPNSSWTNSAGTSTEDSEWVVYGKDTEWGKIGSYDAENERTLSNDVFAKADISLFPVPAINSLTFKSGINKVGVFKIFSVGGKLLLDTEGNLSNKVLDVSNLSKGSYILKVSEKNNYQTYKFIK